MKRLSFFGIILCALLAIGLTAQAQNGHVYIRGIGGLYNVDTLNSGQDILFHIAFRNDIGLRADVSNGYEISTPDGAVWDSITIDTVPPNKLNAEDPPFAENWFHKYFDIAWSTPAQMKDLTPSAVDSVYLLGAGNNTTSKRFPNNADTVVYDIHVYMNPDKNINDGKHICIDSAFYAPGGTWVWATGSGDAHTPAWEGFAAAPTGCFPLYAVPNLYPTVKNTGQGCASAYVDPNISGSHCSALTYDFDPCQPDVFIDPVTFSSTGVGSIDPVTGVWSATGLAVGTYTVSVKAHAQGPAVNMTVNVTNAAPVISGGCGTVTITNTGAIKNVQMAGTDADACDPKNWTIGSITPATGATATIDATGKVTFSATDAGNYTVSVCLSDGIVTTPVCCDIFFEVAAGSLYGVRIEKTHGTLQGGFESVDVILESINTDAVLGGLGGFDILIGYDNSALSLQGVSIATSGLYQTCKWEYFTYRFGANGNCSGGCPSGLVRVVGLAESNNGAAHPICVPKYVPTLPTVMFTLNFLVSNDRTLECQYVPIRFFWIDCGDNSLSNWDGSQLYIAGRVFEYMNQDVPVDPAYATFPGYAGVPAGFCLQDPNFPNKPGPDRNIDFYNGGIDIVCADSIDARGDINLNNVGYEIADAVMFTNYFVKGVSAFGTHVAGSTAASDVNADGLALSVADLVYLIRVIVGDALPYPKTAPVQATYVNDNGTLSVDMPMGAAYVVIKGEAAPELLAQNMEMSYGVREGNTHVIIYPSFNATVTESFTGNFLNAKGEILSVEMATADGAPVVAKMIPANFGLAQNYPNPFNPTTELSFSLPVASQYTLTVYNVTGQKVTEFSGAKEAGTHTITFNGDGMASGVYFYKLVAGNFSATKKMVLLK
jgi:hypothetical protein